MEKIFKAKRLDNGDWVEFNLDTYSCRRKGCTPYVDKHFAHQMPINKNTICQYTGINDSEGNRIFEGDELKGLYNTVRWKFHVNWNQSLGKFYNHVSPPNWRYLILTGHNIHDKV